MEPKVSCPVVFIILRTWLHYVCIYTYAHILNICLKLSWTASSRNKELPWQPSYLIYKWTHVLKWQSIYIYLMLASSFCSLFSAKTIGCKCQSSDFLPSDPKKTCKQYETFCGQWPSKIQTKGSHTDICCPDAVKVVALYTMLLSLNI